MDKNIAKQINILVADNRLEEALDLIIASEQSKNQERYTTFLLLKGKLDMLEEQELAGLLDFDEVAKQKMRIAHAILRMTNDETAAPPIENPVPAKKVEVQKTADTSSPIFKYLFFGLLAIATLVGIFFMVKPKPEPPVEEPSQEQVERTKEKEEEKMPATEKEITADREKDPKVISQDETTNLQKDKTQDKPTELIKDLSENIKPVPTLPTSPKNKVLLIGFPILNKAFNFSDIRYTFKDVQIDRYETNQLKLTLVMDLYCRNNLGYCEREDVLILADENIIKPISQKSNKSAMEQNTRIQDELIFVFPSDAKAYRIQLTKNHSDWTRGFKILQ